MASIVIKGLTKSFNAGSDAPAAVSNLDLDIKDNQFVTLLGPSGCGKTTTLRMIAGYIEPVAALAIINMLIIGAAIFVANKLGGGKIASRSGPAQGLAS